LNNHLVSHLLPYLLPRHLLHYSLPCQALPHPGYLLRPSEDREELDKLLHTSDVISMRLLSLEFDSELLMMSACSIWLHSVTRLEYTIDPDLFSV
jgi:hypothetical protein